MTVEEITWNKIHSSIRLLSSAIYPYSDYFRYRDQLCSEQNWLDSILHCLNLVEEEQFITDNCHIHLDDNQYEILKGWITKKAAHKKAELYYQYGISDDNDRIDFVDYIQFKSLAKLDNTIDNGDSREVITASALALRLVFDTDAIKTEFKRKKSLDSAKADWLQDKRLGISD